LKKGDLLSSFFKHFFVTHQIRANVRCIFIGDYINWTGSKCENGSKTKVKIDDKEVSIVDQYGPVNGEPFHWDDKCLKPGGMKLNSGSLTGYEVVRIWW